MNDTSDTGEYSCENLREYRVLSQELPGFRDLLRGSFNGKKQIAQTPLSSAERCVD
jgi:hypothetical protein